MKSSFPLIALLVGIMMSFASPSSAQNQKGGGYKAPALSDKYLTVLGYSGQKPTEKKSGVWTLPGGITIYSSHPYGDDIKGYGGATPLFIAVNKKGVIQSVAPTVNTESPQFWQKVRQSKLFTSWNGLTLKKAATRKVDAVSGATLSSTAVIRTVQATAKAVGK